MSVWTVGRDREVTLHPWVVGAQPGYIQVPQVPGSSASSSASPEALPPLTRATLPCSYRKRDLGHTDPPTSQALQMTQHPRVPGR